MATPSACVPSFIAGGDRPEPSVAIGDHESDADRDLEARDAEESKRLLYVSLTRARDRLYLAATLTPDGRFVPFKGGLGRTLPPSLAALISAAGMSSAATVAWQGASAPHEFRVLRASAAPALAPPTSEDVAERLDDFSTLAASGSARIAATGDADVSGPATKAVLAGSGHGDPTAAAANRALGRLVHRALQGGLAGRPLEQDAARLHTLLPDEERVLIENVPALVARASSILARLRDRPDLAGVVDEASAGVRWRRHELPFSLRRPDGTIVRGSIDCVLQYTDGRMEVLEFKTGQRAPQHRDQLDIYVAAARALFPDARVAGRLVYVDEP